jgi:hypothetical protein
MTLCVTMYTHTLQVVEGVFKENTVIQIILQYLISSSRFLIRENPNSTTLPLDSKNQESAQIPGFWHPMVKWCNWDFL